MKINHLLLRAEVLLDLNKERERQIEKWGPQWHEIGAWMSILQEEYGEVGEATQPYFGLTTRKETDADDLYTELIQLAAVSIAIAEQLKAENLLEKSMDFHA